MQKYFAIVFFIGLCYGYSLGLEEDILSLPVLDYDDTKNYDLFWDAQYNILKREKNQEQNQEWEQILKQLCENNDFTLENVLIDCENIKITPKVKRTIIKKRDVTEVLEEGSGDDAPEDPKVEEKVTGSLIEQSVPVESGPVETAPVDSAPVTPAPEESKKDNSAPSDSTSVDLAPLEPLQAEAGSVKTALEEVAAVEAVPVEAVPVEAVPAEVTPVEAAKVEEAKVEEAKVEAAKAETGMVETAKVDAESVKASPVQATTPVDAAPVKASPVGAAHRDAPPIEVVATPEEPVRLGSAAVGSAPAEPAPVETAAPDESAPHSSKTTEPVSKATTVASETTKLLNKEENIKLEKGDKTGSNVEEFDEKNEVSEDKKGRKLTQEYINDEQNGAAIYKLDAGITETEAKLGKMKTNESMRAASIGGVGESTEANVGGSDNKILITLFVGLLAVGMAAFSYNYIKKKKRNSTQSRTKNGVVQSDPEEGSEMKPLVQENSPNVEFKNEKNENVST